MTKKKVAAFFTAAALCGALAVGSSMAYLTDHDSVTNKSFQNSPESHPDCSEKEGKTA